MTTGMTTTREATAAAAASRMAAWWSVPIRQEVVAWRASRDRDRRLGAELGVDDALLLGLAEGLSEPWSVLREEYERLLVGPGQTPCPPYEAVWRNDRPRRETGMVSGTATRAVLALYARLGLRVAEERHELPDHIAIEWEALSVAIGAGSPVVSALVNDHLCLWVPPFCSAVEAGSRSRFLTALARLTPAWLEAVRRLTLRLDG